MNAEKLSSDEVPSKFIEWLLSMGCPAYNVPNVQNISEVCRGQYYMVWRGFIERVESKEVIRQKRLQVFSDDIRRCKTKNAFNEKNSSILVPEELLLWQEQTELRKKVKEAENRVSQYQKDLNQITEKISKKVLLCKSSERSLLDLQRRAWLLQSVAQDLKSKKENLNETKTIADSLCLVDEGGDVQEKLQKCITSLKKQGVQGPTLPTANSSVMSNSGEAEFEEELLSVVRCRGDVVCSHLYERRAALIPRATTPPSPLKHSISPQCVVAHTAALHCNLSLKTMKKRVHLNNANAKLAPALMHLNTYLSTESCELLVLQCENENFDARVRTLRRVLDEITSRSGVFQLEEDIDRCNVTKSLAGVNKIIISKRDELKQVMTSLTVTERKIQNVKECLSAVFNSFRDMTPVDNDKYKALQLDMPQENLSSLCHFYETHRERRRNKMELSMDLDASERSYNDVIDMYNARFIDEINFYLKKFNLEKNKKLVLDSGEKIWIFETIDALVSRIHDVWITNDCTSDVLCPNDSLTINLSRLVLGVQRKEQLERKARALDCSAHICDIDIKSKREQEEQIVDKIKKRLTESFSLLQKTQRTLDKGDENLKFWSDNTMKKYISPKRLVDGLTYKQYEEFYLDSFA